MNHGASQANQDETCGGPGLACPPGAATAVVIEEVNSWGHHRADLRKQRQDEKKTGPQPVARRHLLARSDVKPEREKEEQQGEGALRF